MQEHGPSIKQDTSKYKLDLPISLLHLYVVPSGVHFSPCLHGLLLQAVTPEQSGPGNIQSKNVSI